MCSRVSRRDWSKLRSERSRPSCSLRRDDRTPTYRGATAEFEAFIPEGYSDSGDGLWYRFAEGPCDYGTCTHVELLAYAPCPGGVYIEANTLDGAGRVVGYTNDLIGSLAKGGTGLATLQVAEAGATQVSITEVTCS